MTWRTLAEQMLLSKAEDEAVITELRADVAMTIGELTSAGFLTDATAAELAGLVLAAGPACGRCAQPV